MDEEAAQAERDLLRDMRRRRLTTGATFAISALCLAAVAVGFVSNAGATSSLLTAVFVVTLVAAIGAAVFIPPAVMARNAGLRAFQRWPAWMTGTGLGMGWLALLVAVIAGSLLFNLGSTITESLWIATFFSPAVLWLGSGIALAVSKKNEREQAMEAWAVPTPQEAEAQRRTAQDLQQREHLRR